MLVYNVFYSPKLGRQKHQVTFPKSRGIKLTFIRITLVLFTLLVE